MMQFDDSFRNQVESKYNILLLKHAFTCRIYVKSRAVMGPIMASGQMDAFFFISRHYIWLISCIISRFALRSLHCVG